MLRTVIFMLTLLVGITTAYPGILKGYVYSSEDDSPLIGATVRVDAESVQEMTVSTGNKGRFSIAIPDSVAGCSLTISCSGYESHTLSVINPSGEIDCGKVWLNPETSILGEVTVSASSSGIIALPDKNIIFPTQLEKERATDSMDLLSQLSYIAPALSVDRRVGSASVDGHTAMILVNGRTRSAGEISALDPKDIVKVEYITYPDIRYRAPYINIILRKDPGGGALMAQAGSALTARDESHRIYGSFNKGKHGLTFGYEGLFRDSRHEHSDQTEIYLAPDRTFSTSLLGLPSCLIDRDHSASLEYTLTGAPKKLFSTKLSLRRHSQDRRLEQLSTGLNDPFTRKTIQDLCDLSPALELYGSLPVGSNGRLEMDLTGAYSSGRYLRSLSQSDGYSDLTSVDARSYSAEGSVYYEHSLSWSSVGALVIYRHNSTLNRYDTEVEQQRNTMGQSTGSASASMSGQIGNLLYYYASAGATFSKVERGCASPFANVTLQRGFGPLRLTYSFSMSSRPEGLSSYSDVVLPVNRYLYRTGNPDLRDRSSISNSLSAGYSYRKFSARINLSLRNGRNLPVTLCEYVDEASSQLYGKFLETTVNSLRDSEFSGSLTLGLSNLLGHYSLRASASYRDASCRLGSHRWNKGAFSGEGSASVYFGSWQFGIWGRPFPDYSLYGNFLWRNAPTWGIHGSWHRGPWSFSCEISDLFARYAYHQVKTTMAIGSVNRTESWIGDKNNLIRLTVRYQIEFGRRRQGSSRNLNGDTRVNSGVNPIY